MAGKQASEGNADRGESIVSMSTMKTAVGDIDTMTISPKGDTEVEVGEADEGDQNGVQINDKVGAREGAPADKGGDGEAAEGEEGNANLSDEVGDRPKKKPFKATRDGRINALTGKLRETERTAEDYRRELEEERAKRAAIENEKRLSDYAAVMHYSDKLKADERELIRELKDAKDKADTEKEAEIQSKLSDVQGRKREAEAWVNNNKPPEAPPKKEATAEQPAPKEQPRPKVTYQGEAARWVQENPWFNEGTPDYDPDLSTYARNFATGLEIRLKRAGNEAAIGSKDYFAAIDNHMRQAFPDAFGDDDDGDEPPAETPPPRGNGIAPARSSGGQPARTGQPANPNKVVLTQEQREVAHGMILRHPDGRSFSPREKEIAYAKSLVSLKKGA